MGSLEKIALAIVGVAMATTLLLPGRQTAAVLGAAGNVFTGGIKSAMGR
jgi:hypothetical protein